VFFAVVNVPGFAVDAGFLMPTATLPGFAPAFLTLVFAAAFLVPAAAAFAPSVFCVNSNAGFGTARSCGKRVISAAGFTPAAAANFAAAGLNSAAFAGRCGISGFTMIWLS
jgi:hypothetical protein